MKTLLTFILALLSVSVSAQTMYTGRFKGDGGPLTNLTSNASKQSATNYYTGASPWVPFSGNTSVYFVSPQGNDATASAGNTNNPWGSLLGWDGDEEIHYGVLSAATNAGNIVFMYPGTYRINSSFVQSNMPAILSPGTVLVGSGVTNTFIDFRYPNQFGLKPGDGCTISNLTVYVTQSAVGDYMWPVGGNNAANSLSGLNDSGMAQFNLQYRRPFTNFLAVNCRFIGSGDAFFVQQTNKCSGKFINCEFISNWDGIALFGTNTDTAFEFINCKIGCLRDQVAMPFAPYVAGLIWDSGRLILKGSTIGVTNGGVGGTYSIWARTTNAFLTVRDTVVYYPSTNGYATFMIGDKDWSLNTPKTNTWVAPPFEGSLYDGMSNRFRIGVAETITPRSIEANNYGAPGTLLGYSSDQSYSWVNKTGSGLVVMSSVSSITNVSHTTNTYIGSVAIAPGNVVTVAGWMPITNSGARYYVPLYQ